MGLYFRRDLLLTGWLSALRPLVFGYQSADLWNKSCYGC
jgi:hypothetical protein